MNWIVQHLSRILLVLGTLSAFLVGWWFAAVLDRNQQGALQQAVVPPPLTENVSLGNISVSLPVPSPTPTISIVDILAHERAQASAAAEKEEKTDQSELARLEIPSVFRLLLKVPAPVPSPTPAVVQQPTPAPHKKTIVPTLPPLIAKLPEYPPLFTIDQLLAEGSLLDDASIDYNPTAQTWKARWEKPRIFHFGMILRPELMKRVQNGQEFQLSVRGETSIMGKDSKGDLVLRSGNKTVPLGARDVLILLQNRIDTERLTLYVDAAGNLIMETQGAAAQLLGKRSHR